MEFVRDLFTTLSLAWTIPAVMGSIGVVVLWYNSAWEAWKNAHKTEVHWFVLGVAIGFVGAVMDNLYWGAAWTADFYNHPARDELFHNGVYSNLIFRQGCTAAAAYCHIRAAVASDTPAFRIWITWSWIVGIFVAIFLLMTGSSP